LRRLIGLCRLEVRHRWPAVLITADGVSEAGEV